MSGEATVRRIRRAADRVRGVPRCRLAGGALLVVAAFAGLTLGGAPAQAAFPGINGKLFCQEGSAPGPATKAQNIFSINPDGSGRTLVTNTTFIDPADPNSGFSNNRDVRVSPDGKRVVFTSNRSGALSLYTMNSDGTGPATLVASPVAPAFGYLSSSWSSDGTKILTTELNPNANGEIISMNADGSNQVNLTNRPSQDVAPAMSPDGRKILFHSNRNFAPISPGDQDIYSMDPDGSNVQNITNDSNPDRNDLYPNWSPDGTQFVFERATNLSLSTASSNIYKMNANGTGLTQLTFTTTGLTRFPVWSPDGTRISFDSIRDTLPAPDPQNREVYTMRADGTDVRRVTNAAGSDSQCDWQTIPRPAAVPPVPEYPVPPQPAPPPANVAVKFTAKLALARATINRHDRALDVLAPITALASGRVRVELFAAGRRFRFTAPIDSRNGRIRFRHRIPLAQAQLGTGIVTITYAGDGDTRSQTVRLRAANRPAILRLSRPRIVNDRVRASGTISPLARGVVRVQLEYVRGGATQVLPLRAKISNGHWSLNTPLPAAQVAAIAARTGTVHSYTLFTGYFPRRMRGEMRSFEVLGNR